ncbi:MAG: Plug and carboxypeptidase regulatory-like domain-containing protein, partial [Acidobacteria bacterium]|nr:Plug and carboxypeptidase regulatory-like domain-containing protein [Acidobacteriota bacterium]
MKRGLLFLAVFTGWAALVPAQTVSGVITGSVKDQTDAVIVGANLTLIQEATGARRTAATNEVGLYAFNSLQPGSYTLQVEQSGFKTFRRTSIALTANERLPIDVKLELGASAETVRVEAQGATVQTASADRSGTVTATQLQTLQLKGRDFMGLLKLVPGVVDTNQRESPTNNSLSGLFIQGGRQGTYNLTLDGITNLDTGSNTGPYFEPSMDSIAEVKVLLTNYQAEYGRNSGATINAIMKSGSKNFHGSGYYYKRNEALNANNFFNNSIGRRRDFYRYDLFGYTVGGPVLLPGGFNKNRDKLFFFFSQEIAPQRLPLTLTFRTTPTELERRGNFSQTLEADGRLIAIRDSAAGAPFPGNVVPLSRINPNGQALLNLFPLPNTSSPTRQYNYYFQNSLNRPRHVEMLRADYAINSTTTFYARGIHSYEKFEGTKGVVGITSNWPQFPTLYSLKGLGFVANLTKVISPSTVNEFSFGINRGVQDRGPLNEESLAANQRRKRG